MFHEIQDEALRKKDERIQELEKEVKFEQNQMKVKNEWLDECLEIGQGRISEITRLRKALKHCSKWFEAMIDILEKMGAGMTWAKEVLGIATEALKEGKEDDAAEHMV